MSRFARGVLWIGAGVAAGGLWVVRRVLRLEGDAWDVFEEVEW